MFVRDISSKGLVNTDVSSFNKYKREREKTREIEVLKNRVEKLEKICDMLTKEMSKQ